MQVSIYKTPTWIDITEYISSLSIGGEYRTCCRTADISVIQSPTDKNIKKLDIEVGDTVKASADGKLLFYGKVVTKTQSSDSNTIEVNLKDYGMYLLNIKANYTFSGLSPDDIVKKLCGDFKIKVGNIAPSNAAITRSFVNTSLYKIIMSAYTMADDKKYMCVFEGEKLNVIKKGEIIAPAIQSGENLLVMNVSESFATMVNSVRVYSDNGEVISNFENEEDVKRYGLHMVSMKTNGSDIEKMARKKLKGLESKITVTCLGNGEYMTGRAVTVKEPYTGVIGLFYIDEDRHIYKNGIYTNALTLNFENLMEESS